MEQPAAVSQPDPISSPLHPRPGHRHRGLVPLVLCLIYLAQCAWFLRTQSLTYDEPAHIAAGLDAWRNGRFEQWNDHPPLARLLCTLPLLGARWRAEVEPQPLGFRVTRLDPDPVSLAWRARSGNVLLGLLLALLLWFTARRMWSWGAADLALALFVFSPAAIAHFSVATTDGAGTLLTFAAAAQLLRWRRNPSWLRTALLGVLLGSLLLAKFYTVVVFAMVVVGMLVLKPEGTSFHPLRWNWGKAVAAAAMAFCVVWGGYGFHVSHLTVQDGQLVVTFANREPIVKTLRTRVNLSLRVPAGEYFEGIRTVLRHNRHGQPAFFLGQVSPTGGWKLYYPVVVLLKWPAVVLLLFGVALGLRLARRLPLPEDVRLMMVFPVVFFVLAIFARFDLGERHILPLYPFVLLWVAGLWEFARRRPTIFVVLVLAVSVHAADGLRCAPDYLSCFNLFVPPGEGYQYLTDSNLDWGQGLLALRHYQDEHPSEKISLAYFGSVPPEMYGIRAQLLHPGERASGTVIVSATSLSGQFLDDPHAYRWVLQYPRKAILNQSLFVFEVPPRE